jgi:hypothetical protein
VLGLSHRDSVLVSIRVCCWGFGGAQGDTKLGIGQQGIVRVIIGEYRFHPNFLLK